MNLFNFAMKYSDTNKNYYYASTNYCNRPYCCGSAFMARKHVYPYATHHKKHIECRYCNHYCYMAS